MEQREQKPNLFGFCRVVTEEGEANHEFYKYYDVATLPDGYLLKIRPNVFSHYNGVVRIGDTDIILSTLWSRIPLEDAYFTEQVISDFRRILYKGELMTHAQFNAEHERCLTFIKDAVAHSQAVHKIVVTHHVPSFRMLHPKFQGSKANGASKNTPQLSQTIRKQMKYLHRNIPKRKRTG